MPRLAGGGPVSSLSSGGGGDELYKDGDPVSEQLISGESITVPSGETWVLKIVATATGGRDVLRVNDTEVATVGTNTGDEATEDLFIQLSAGDTLKVGSTSFNGGHISGWPV